MSSLFPRVLAPLASLALILTGCGQPTSVKVRIENVTAFQFLKSGVYNTPVGASAPGPIRSGQAYELTFTAGKGQRLSFASMFGASNDWFFAPAASGIALYTAQGEARSGDVTSEVQLWNAGTEVDQEPGVGADTGPKQGSPDQGAADPNNTVRALTNPVMLTAGGTFTMPAVADMIRVTLTPTSTVREFKLRIENVSTSTTLQTSEGAKPVGISPGVWAVHGSAGSLFTEGQADSGQGLERIAESGNVAPLQTSIAPKSGVATGFSPGIWVIHTAKAPLFAVGMPDRGQGLEHLSEDGDRTDLATALGKALPAGAQEQGQFTTPVGAASAGPITPGGAFELTVDAMPGERLSFASMFGASNDWFIGPGEDGIALFDAQGMPRSGDVTAEVKLWDVGTEQSEEPGVGPNTGPQQSAPNTGPADSDNKVREVPMTVFATPLSQYLKVTLTPASM